MVNDRKINKTTHTAIESTTIDMEIKKHIYSLSLIKWKNIIIWIIMNYE